MHYCGLAWTAASPSAWLSAHDPCIGTKRFFLIKDITEVQKQTRKNNHYEKEKGDYASNYLFADQTPNTQDVKAPQAVKVHDLQNDALKKETTLMPLSSLL
jgi:hypothetical protein